MKPWNRIPVVALLCALPAAAQELPPLPGGPTQGGNAGQEELLRLFNEVELGLRSIDTYLFEAAAGEVELAGFEDAGIERLLQEARQQAATVRENIDRILEIARQQNQGGGGGGGGQSEPSESQGSPAGQSGGQPGGQRPGDGSGGGGGARERTPDAPDGQGQPGGDQGQGEGDGQGQDPGQQEGEQQGGEDGDPNQQNGQPKGNGPDDPDAQGRNEAAQDPTGGETARAPGAGASVDQWGHLPIHAREVFRVEGGSDMPPHYRDWIDGYYRRLNRASPRD